MGHLALEPARCVSVPLARAPLRGGNCDKLEPRMIGEQPDERLPNRPGGSEHGHFPFLPIRGRTAHSHDARSVRARRSYVSTLARSSSTSMYSSGVCATCIEPGPNKRGVPHRVSSGMSDVYATGAVSKSGTV